MNKKQYIILGLIIIVAGIFIYISEKKKTDPEFSFKDLFNINDKNENQNITYANNLVQPGQGKSPSVQLENINDYNQNLELKERPPDELMAIINPNGPAAAREKAKQIEENIKKGNYKNLAGIGRITNF